MVAMLLLPFQMAPLDLAPLHLAPLDVAPLGPRGSGLAGLVAWLEILSAEARYAFAAGAAAFARIGAAFAVLPAFGERVVPARIRLAGALAMSLVITSAMAFPPIPDGVLAITRYFAGEALAGLALGLSLRLMVMALQIAGTIAAQSMSLSQFFGGAGADPQPAMSQVLMLAGLALLAAAGLPEKAAAYLLLGYVLLPPGEWPDSGALAQWGTARVAHGFALGFTLAAPFVIGAALYNLALGAINRAMPQLMVAFIGAPALTLGGLALLALAAPFMMVHWLDLALGLLADPARHAGPL